MKSEKASGEQRAPEETAEETAEPKAAEEKSALEQTETDLRTDTARTRGGAHARGRRRGIGRSTIWKPVFAIALLVLLATAVTLVLLQSAGVIDWGFLGPNA